MLPAETVSLESNNMADTLPIKSANKVKRITYLFIKKSFDVICSLFAVLFLIPLWLFIKLAYLFSGDTNPVLYTQKRIGKNGEEFDFYKFRSMIPNADEELKKILAEDPKKAEEYALNKKLENDPRVTKVGAFLRKTSLDEFPQFINVLKGDMAIIGNRPYLPREKEDMGDYFEDIEKTKCGIVSYWAVMGRSDVSFEKRLELEKYYSDNQTLLLDLSIFVKVFKIVLLRKGAK